MSARPAKRKRRAPSPALNQLRETFREHLYLPDPMVVDVTAATVIANRLPSDPVWVIVVGGPGTGKTEAIQSTRRLHEVRSVSTLTGKTFLSGKPGKEVSLLHKMDAENQSMLVMKDFGTILSQRPDDRAEVLAALREIYDGEFNKETGVGLTLHWRGHLGFLAGATPAIELHSQVLGVLGERFLYLRLPRVDPWKISAAAIEEDDETGMRKELQAAMSEFIASIDLDEVPEVPSDVKLQLQSLAIRTAWLRTAVPRDAYKRDILMRPTDEAPTRIVKQLRQLWRAALLIGHEDPIDFARRIARDSTTPADRLATVAYIAQAHEASTTQIRKHLELPYTTCIRIIEDLVALGVLYVTAEGGKSEGGKQEPNVYQITEPAWSLFTGNVPELQARKSRSGGNGRGPSTSPPTRAPG